MVLVLFVIYTYMYLYFYLHNSYCKVLFIVHTHVSYAIPPTTPAKVGCKMLKNLYIDNSFLYVFFLVSTVRVMRVI